MNTLNDLSIIIPVLKEGDRVVQAVQRIFDQNYKGMLEIIVSDGDKAGSTINFITDTRVVCTTSEAGRGKQLNKGAQVASGRVFLFLHCDTVLPDNALNDLMGVMERPEIAAGAFDLGINNQNLVFRMIEKLSSLRSRLTRIPYGDQALFVRRSCFFQVGCFAEIPIMEDVDFMRRLKREKSRIYFLDSKVLTSARRWEKEGVFFCTLRNWIILGLYYLGVHPDKLVRFYKLNS